MNIKFESTDIKFDLFVNDRLNFAEVRDKVLAILDLASPKRTLKVQVGNLIDEKKISAIKLVRHLYATTLKDAKDFVDQAEKNHIYVPWISAFPSPTDILDLQGCFAHVAVSFE